MSLSDKTKRWLNENCKISLKGKTVLVTGANSGVGFKMAEISAYLGADVILACRNKERAKEARLRLIGDHPEASISVMQLDLASLSSIEVFCEELVSSQVDIDAFVNNAGVFRQPGKKTADGFDLVIGTNYIGTYYLSERLLPYLSSLPHEVVYVNTISIIHKIATVDYADFYYEREKRYRAFPVYARSKLCLARYTYAQAKRYAGSNVRMMMNHPGMTITPMGLNAFGNGIGRLAGVVGPLINSPEKSALSLAYILSHEIPSGSIIGPNKGFGGWGYPEMNRIGQRVKEGAEELIRFTDIEIEKAKA
ncbi:MAG: SDR family NAD(P)-dependent oxidoreductase [Clostridia bacterium]|nr:SDR family NAD(P)-dependent oxidoreductase [Clostridia bacterium]